MKAITVRQPHASLIAIGAKRIETRSWPTKYRGTLAIHAGVKDPSPLNWRVPGWYLLSQQTPFYWMIQGPGVLQSLPLGCIVATCELVDVVRTEDIWTDGTEYEGTSPGGGWLRQQRGGPVAVTQNEVAFGDYSAHRFAWLLDKFEPLAEPIPARGKQGLWEWNEMRS